LLFPGRSAVSLSALREAQAEAQAETQAESLFAGARCVDILANRGGAFGRVSSTTGVDLKRQEAQNRSPTGIEPRRCQALFLVSQIPSALLGMKTPGCESLSAHSRV